MNAMAAGRDGASGRMMRLFNEDPVGLFG